MSVIFKHVICIIKYENKNLTSAKDTQAMVGAIYTDISHSNVYHSLTKYFKSVGYIPVSETVSCIIKDIFNHYFHSFLPRDKTLPSGKLRS